MPRYIALLRAINVGGHTVKMERLRGLFEEMGFGNPRTLIASGNVLFDARSRKTDAIEIRIEGGLSEALGYDVATFVREPHTLSELVNGHPYGDFEARGQGLYIGFLKSALDPQRTADVLAHQTPEDVFHIGDRALYWLRHGGFSDSAVSVKSLERAIGAPFTFRNVTTVRKLALPERA